MTVAHVWHSIIILYILYHIRATDTRSTQSFVYFIQFPFSSQFRWKNNKMPRKKPVKDPQDEIDAACKLLCDEAANHMKVRNYTKALTVYEKVKIDAIKPNCSKQCHLFLSNALPVEEASKAVCPIFQQKAFE